MSKKELGIIPRLRWVITGIAGASLLASVFFAARGGVFARDWGTGSTYLHHWHDGKFCGIYSP